MEVYKTIIERNLHRIINVLFFSAMFALPWINITHVTSFFFFIIGIVLFFSGSIVHHYPWFRKQKPFIFLLVYFSFPLISYCLASTDTYARSDIEMKSSFVFIPLLLSVLIHEFRDIWRLGVIAFISGVTIAALFCLFNAILVFNTSHDHSIFFYHLYAAPTGLSAIYFSIYLLIAIWYLTVYFFSGVIPIKSKLLFLILLTFLFLNLLLLSSKMIIVSGVLLTIFMFVRLIKDIKLRFAIIAIVCLICVAFAITKNPVRKRYANVNYHDYYSVFKTDSFTNYNFDGLSIRLLLWRMGNEIINENKSWVIGSGGSKYHEEIKIKLHKYHVYTGNPLTKDTGYQNYNLHNQYIESYVQFGMIGLAVLLSFLSFVFFTSFRAGNIIIMCTILLYAITFLTESLLETQAGIILFTTIICGEWVQMRTKYITAWQ